MTLIFAPRLIGKHFILKYNFNSKSHVTIDYEILCSVKGLFTSITNLGDIINCDRQEIHFVCKPF